MRSTVQLGRRDHKARKDPQDKREPPVPQEPKVRQVLLGRKVNPEPLDKLVRPAHKVRLVQWEQPERRGLQVRSALLARKVQSA